MPYVLDPENLIPKMTSLTAPSGTASASTRINNTYAAWKAMNQASSATDYWSATVATGWLAYQFTTKKLINKYSIYSRPGYATTAPKNFTFEGYNGTSWVVLDTQTNITGWLDGVKKTFYFPNTTAYIQYRINVTANNGATNLVISEIEMMMVSMKANTNIISLLHFDGNILDETGKVWTAENGGATTTTQKYFGTGSFNANGGYITIPKTSLDLASLSEFTIQFRVRISAYTGNQKVFADGDGQVTTNESLYISTEGDNGLSLRTLGNGYDTRIYTGPLIANNWHHIAAVFKNGYFYLFADGVLKQITVDAHNLQGGLSMWAIGATPTGNQPMSGSFVDEFRIDNVALWTEDFAVPTEPFIMYTGTLFYPPTLYM